VPVHTRDHVTSRLRSFDETLASVFWNDTSVYQFEHDRSKWFFCEDTAVMAEARRAMCDKAEEALPVESVLSDAKTLLPSELSDWMPQPSELSSQGGRSAGESFVETLSYRISRCRGALWGLSEAWFINAAGRLQHMQSELETHLPEMVDALVEERVEVLCQSLWEKLDAAREELEGLAEDEVQRNTAFKEAQNEAATARSAQEVLLRNVRAAEEAMECR